MKRLPILLLLGIAAPGAAWAGQMTGMAMSSCPADAEPLPPELAGWASRAPLAAARDAGGLGKAELTIGMAVDLGLAATPDVGYVLRPEHPGGSVSHGGMARFTAAEAGTYRVALGSAAWIDVVRDGAAAESVAHGHGPACSGIRKMVDFALDPGTYVLQVAGNGDGSVPVLVARLR